MSGTHPHQPFYDEEQPTEMQMRYYHLRELQKMANETIRYVNEQNIMKNVITDHTIDHYDGRLLSKTEMRMRHYHLCVLGKEANVTIDYVKSQPGPRLIWSHSCPPTDDESHCAGGGCVQPARVRVRLFVSIGGRCFGLGYIEG